MAGAIERERQIRQLAFHRRDVSPRQRRRGLAASARDHSVGRLGARRRASAATAPRPRASFASPTITWPRRSRSTSRSARARRSTARFRNHIEIIDDAPERTQTISQTAARRRAADRRTRRNGSSRTRSSPSTSAYFAIEADTGSESIEAVIKPKIRAYREIVASGMIDDHFGIDNLRVLFVTTNEKRMRNMMAAVASIARDGRSTMFGFACRPDLGQLAGAPAPDGRMFPRSVGAGSGMRIMRLDWEDGIADRSLAERHGDNPRSPRSPLLQFAQAKRGGRDVPCDRLWRN